jgi:hypothetical protein
MAAAANVSLGLLFTAEAPATISKMLGLEQARCSAAASLSFHLLVAAGAAPAAERLLWLLGIHGNVLHNSLKLVKSQ